MGTDYVKFSLILAKLNTGVQQHFSTEVQQGTCDSENVRAEYVDQRVRARIEPDQIYLF